MLYPAELRAVSAGRGGEIRTPDILLPKQARYQTTLHPVKETELYNTFFGLPSQPFKKSIDVTNLNNLLNSFLRQNNLEVGSFSKFRQDLKSCLMSEKDVLHNG